MPIATPDVYRDMLDNAKENGFAYPAINCTSSETINAVSYTHLTLPTTPYV